MVGLSIANNVSDLILGDVREHLPLDRIPLSGDVLGLGTTTSIDNGELSFLQSAEGDTKIWKCQAHDGSVRELRHGDGSGHFPYVCFTADATAFRRPFDLQRLDPSCCSLQGLISEAISISRCEGELEEASIYGIRLMSFWQELVITIASKLCMGQQRRNSQIASSKSGDATASRSLYELLQHYRLAASDPCQQDDPIQFLGNSLQWDCCGFFDMEPTSGRVTVPEPGAHLHLHGCSTDLRFGGHLHHEHSSSRLNSLGRLVIYPIQQINYLASDLSIEKLTYCGQTVDFTVANRGTLDVSDVGVAVVVNDRFGDHRYLRLPWLAAGEQESFSLDWPLLKGQHRVEVIADPEGDVLEDPKLLGNNRMSLLVNISSS